MPDARVVEETGVDATDREVGIIQPIGILVSALSIRLENVSKLLIGIEALARFECIGGENSKRTTVGGEMDNGLNASIITKLLNAHTFTSVYKSLAMKRMISGVSEVLNPITTLSLARPIPMAMSLRRRADNSYSSLSSS